MISALVVVALISVGLFAAVQLIEFASIIQSINGWK